MRVTADTNVLIRAAIEDDPDQAVRAQRALMAASVVAITTAALCEFTWVMLRGHKLPSAQVASWIRQLLETANVEADHRTIATGLAFLDAGGDFADGIIAHEGGMLGCETLLTFDRKALAIAASRGLSAIEP